MRKEIWYRADYDYIPENFGGGTDEYFCRFLDEKTTMKDLDEDVIQCALDYAKEGTDFADVGHVEMELVQITEVDGEKEFFPEIRKVWW